MMIMEGLTLLACLPAMAWGSQFGWFSVGLFVALVFVCRVLTISDLRLLAQEKLHADPTNPT
jgi:hypothetical protein